MHSPKDTVKDKLPIGDVVGTYIKLERAGRNLRARCPFHKERTPSFYVSPERGTYYCFGCGEKGDIFSFTEKMEGTDFRGALRLLAERAGVELGEYRGESGPTKDERERLFDLMQEAVTFFKGQMGKHSSVGTYLSDRGLMSETIEKWSLGYAPLAWRDMTESLRAKGYTDAELVTSGLCIKSTNATAGIYDRFRGRIMFPLWDSSGRPIAFSGRLFEKMPTRAGGSEKEDEAEPAKYVNSPETPLFHKSRVLYGLDRAKGAMRRSDFAILVEGQMDLLMMHQCGFPNAVAASGTAFTEEHANLISHITKRMVLALDGDSAGQKSALRSAQLLYRAGFDVRIASFVSGKDPADIGKENPEELKASVRNAKTAIEFFLDSARTDSKDERAFRKAAEESVLPLIAANPSRIDQAHFIQVTAAQLSLPEDAVRAEVARIKQAPISVVKQQLPAADVAVHAKHGKLETVVGLVTASGDAETLRQLKEMLGDERFAALSVYAGEHTEEFLFLREQEDGSLATKELLALAERECLVEEIEQVRAAMRAAASADDTTAHAASAQKLQALTRKLHGLT